MFKKHKSNNNKKISNENFIKKAKLIDRIYFII